MPLIFKNRHNRIAAQFGAQSALRATSDLVEQLQAQLRSEHRQHSFHVALLEREKALLLHELTAARYELARRDTMDALACADSPSAMRH